MGESAKLKSHLRRRHATYVHDSRRPAGDECCPPPPGRAPGGSVRRKSTPPLPAISQVHRNNTHRLIPSRFSSPEELLKGLSGTAAELKDLVDLTSATDEMSLTHNGLLPAIGQNELASGVPYARIINAAFV